MNIINYSDKWPKYLIYDNGCNTEKYILKHLKQTTLRSQILKKTKLVVDRFHFTTHKDSHIYCKENCNPDNFEDLKNVNTIDHNFVTKNTKKSLAFFLNTRNTKIISSDHNLDTKNTQKSLGFFLNNKYTKILR